MAERSGRKRGAGWRRWVGRGAVALGLALAGCATGGAQSDEETLARLADDASAVFGDAATGQATKARRTPAADAQAGADESPILGSVSGGGGAPAPATVNGWGVLLASASGEQGLKEMEAQRPRLAAMLGRSDVRVSRQRSGYAVVLGAHDSPSDPAAQRDLAFVKSFEVDGRRPFARAHLMPPGQSAAEESKPITTAAKEEWNLAVVREGLGREAGFTLQVGVFESVDRPKAMRAAENWVLELRQAGEEAYFYHGRTASMVSIGVFGREDWDALLDVAGPNVRALQRRFPTLRLERMDQRAGRRGKGDEPARASSLVMIPER